MGTLSLIGQSLSGNHGMEINTRCVLENNMGKEKIEV